MRPTPLHPPRRSRACASGASSYKRSLEYLFYGLDPRLPGEILRVAEEGFRSSEQYARMGLDGAVALSNSLSIADLARVQARAPSRSPCTLPSPLQHASRGLRFRLPSSRSLCAGSPPAP